jgi:hypothetical protein
MKRMQTFYKLNKNILEVWTNGSNIMGQFYISKEELPIVEKLLNRDKKSAILNMKHKSNIIKQLCFDIIENNG